jgi:hypothetical protein
MQLSLVFLSNNPACLRLFAQYICLHSRGLHYARLIEMAGHDA